MDGEEIFLKNFQNALQNFAKKGTYMVKALFRRLKVGVCLSDPWRVSISLRFVSIPLGWVDQPSGSCRYSFGAGDQPLFPRTSRIKTLLLPKFLRVFRELFIKSFLNGVWGNAPNSLFDRSKPEGLHHKKYWSEAPERRAFQ